MTFLGCASDFRGTGFRPQVWKDRRIAEKNAHQEHFSNGSAEENREQSVRKTGDTEAEQIWMLTPYIGKNTVRIITCQNNQQTKQKE